MAQKILNFKTIIKVGRLSNLGLVYFAFSHFEFLPRFNRECNCGRRTSQVRRKDLLLCLLSFL